MELGVGHNRRRRDAPCLTGLTPREECDGALSKFASDSILSDSSPSCCVAAIPLQLLAALLRVLRYCSIHFSMATKPDS
jgi:hypothetical protein